MLDNFDHNIARQLDEEDPLSKYRNLFFFPEHNGKKCIYFCGNSLGLQSKKIENSINNNGFENTANLYSISDSSKVGGKIGWVAKKNLSSQIINKLENLKENEYTSPIKLGNNILILKINSTRKQPNKIDKKAELDKMIFIETTKQLEKFSNIFYNKIKLNAKISEF